MMPVNRGKAVTPGNPYNSISITPSETRHQPAIIRPVTVAALAELDLINTWSEFVATCEAQRRSRGWGL
jgi:hypothetical protein